MLVMPLFHVHGLVCGLLAPLFSGGSMVVPAKFSATDFWKEFTAYGANWYTAVPTIHQILLKNPAPQPNAQDPLHPLVLLAALAHRVPPDRGEVQGRPCWRPTP